MCVCVCVHMCAHMHTYAYTHNHHINSSSTFKDSDQPVFGSQSPLNPTKTPRHTHSRTLPDPAERLWSPSFARAPSGPTQRQGGPRRLPGPRGAAQIAADAGAGPRVLPRRRQRSLPFLHPLRAQKNII